MQDLTTISNDEDLSLDAESFDLENNEIDMILQEYSETNDTLLDEVFYQDVLTNIHTIQDMIRWVYSYFMKSDVYFGHGYENGWQEATVLINNQLALPDCDNSHLYNTRLTTNEKKSILELVTKRVHERIPLAYLIESSKFLGKYYYVDPRVIIPRSPIGELIDEGFMGIVQSLPNHILDLCCGSGVLALAIADRFPEAQVDGIDISTDALDVASINLELRADPALENRVAFIESDLFNNVPQGIKYDLIVSNPPYVNAEDLNSMPLEYHHEPSISLGSGFDGLNITSRILVQAPDYLLPEGVLVVEVGNSRYDLEAALPKVPFNWVELKRGGHGVFSITREQLIDHKDEIAKFAETHHN